MCIVFFTATDHYSLILASNRDEFLARPTTRAGWHDWDPLHLGRDPDPDPDRPVLSGLDLAAGGTWLGLSLQPATRTARITTLTNFTETLPPASRPSRGQLTRTFLDLDLESDGDADPLQNYLDAVQRTKHLYAGFNLIVAEVALAPSSTSSITASTTTTTTRLGYISNRETPTKRARILDDLGTTAHVHGLSNATLEVQPGEHEWPKVKTGAHAVQRAATAAQDDLDRGLAVEEVETTLVERLYDALSTPHPAPIRHRAHLRHTVLVRPLCFDPSTPMSDPPPAFPPPSSDLPPCPPAATPSSASSSSSSPSPPPPPDSLDPNPQNPGAHWYATRVQTLLLIERHTGRVVVRERDAFVLDTNARPVWSGGDERVFRVQL